jgi:hypothetical protein
VHKKKLLNNNINNNNQATVATGGMMQTQNKEGNQLKKYAHRLIFLLIMTLGGSY